MQWKHPDTRLHDDINALNREFLRLLVHAECPREAVVFGLQPHCVSSLRRLTGSQLEAIALSPCLLATLHFGQANYSDSPIIKEQTPTHAASPDWYSDVRVFVAEALTYIKQVSHRDTLAAAFCVGLDKDAADELLQLSFSRVRDVADNAESLLRARFHDHPNFWCDLIRGCAAPDTDLQLVSRLSILPLSVTVPAISPANTRTYRN
jgi:hypothetical protein